MYKGEIANFPVEVVEKMLDYQEKHGYKRNVDIFEKYKNAYEGGFEWENTEEGDSFWEQVIVNENFNLFFGKYPKVNPTTQLVIDFAHSYSSIAAGMIADLTVSGQSDEWVDGNLNKVICTFETIHIPLVTRVLDRMSLSYTIVNQ